MPDPGGATTSKSASGSGSGSGSGSDDSTQTVRQNPKHTAPLQAEHTTFTFSSKRSPFLNTPAPGSVLLTPANRRGSDASRDRTHRRTPGAPQPTSSKNNDSGWIKLRPLEPVKEIPMPLFSSPKPKHIELEPSTTVFVGRSPTQSPSAGPGRAPRLSLIAQHYHATSQHPFFDTPPCLITPPPVDPFSEIAKRDSYFPPAPSPKHTRSSQRKSEGAHKPKHSSSGATITPSNFSQPRTSSSRTKLSSSTTTSSHQEHTTRPRSLFLSGGQQTPRPAPTATPVNRTVFVVSTSQSQSQSQSTTPRPLKSRSPKSVTPPDQNRSSPQPQPSIAVFKDCFGVLADAENVFPVRPRSRSGSRAGSDASSRGRTEFQKRWTRRWLRRTMRGVGSMGSGSGSGSSVDGSAQRRARSTGGTSSPIYLSSRTARSSDGSLDSLDRARVSRSNACSPSEGMSQMGQGAELSDVDEVGTDAERDSPGLATEAKEMAEESLVEQLVADRPIINNDAQELEGNMPTVSVVAA